MRRNLLSLLLALAGLLPANAQYTFTLNVSWSGNCSGYTAQMNSLMGKYKSQAINGFPTRELCEQTRAMCHQELGHIELVYYDVKTGKVIKREATNCKLNVTTSPCTGRPMVGTVGTLNALGVSQGTSFYSANSANEIQNWSSDDMERMLALDKNFNSYEPSNVSTGDPFYDNARTRAGSSLPYIGDGVFKGIPNTPLIEANAFGQANIDNVNRYLENSQGLGIAYIANPQDLSLMLQRQYQSLTGYDINAIMNKMNKTDAEKQAIADYNEYAKRMCDQMASEIEQQMRRIDLSREKKQIDMAILAKDVYGDGGIPGLSETNFKVVDIRNLTDARITNLAKLVDLCNQTNDLTGFHAKLYQNELTGEYALSFEGSNSLPDALAQAGKMLVEKINPFMEKGEHDAFNDWFRTNLSQGLGGVPDQYKLAASIARLITELPSDVNINIVGHSLGGGLASLVGAMTGAPTYTYNAEGVNDNILESCGLKNNVRDANNITAYYSSTDGLTRFQQVASGLAQSLKNVNVMNMAPDNNKMNNDKSNTFAATSIGKHENTGVNGIHFMTPMVEHFAQKNFKVQEEWGRIRYNRNSILAAKQDGSLQKVDHINVIFE